MGKAYLLLPYLACWEVTVPSILCSGPKIEVASSSSLDVGKHMKRKHFQFHLLSLMPSDIPASAPSRASGCCFQHSQVTRRQSHNGAGHWWRKVLSTLLLSSWRGWDCQSGRWATLSLMGQWDGRQEWCMDYLVPVCCLVQPLLRQSLNQHPVRNSLISGQGKKNNKV